MSEAPDQDREAPDRNREAPDPDREAPRQNRWVARPEAAWALWTGIAGALAAAALSLQGIFSAGSAGATFGFLVVPFIAAAAAIPAAVWGAALGHVVLHMRGKIRSPRP